MGSLTNPHGQKHDESHDIRKCLENGGARKVMFMESMNRWAFMCQLEGGKWGFRSVGYDTASHEWYQATSFSDDSFTTQSILEKYLTGRGYSPTGNVMGVSASPSQLYAMLLQAGVVP